MIRSDRKLSFLYAFSDLLILTVVFFGYHYYFHGLNMLNQHLLYVTTLILTWFFITSRNKLYYVNLHSSLRVRFKKDLRSHAAFMGAISLFHLAFNVPGNFTRNQFLAPLITFPLVDVIVNFILYQILIKLRKTGKNVRKLLVIGAGRAGRHLEDYFLKNPDLGFKIIGFLDDELVGNLHSPILGKVYELDDTLKKVDVDEIIIAIPADQHEKIQYIIDRADYYGVRIRFVPDYYELLGRSYKTTNMGDIPVVNIREISLDRLRFYSLKRICDVVFSIFVLLFLAPVFLVLGLLIKMESKGPVFYCPSRLGKSGKPFKLYKFRSMYQNDTSGTKSTVKDDPRVTRIGKFIRKYNLDELPQFLNVLQGSMSVVGPRPHRVYLNEVMQKEVDQYMVRHYLKPGITGWAQVNGWRGPTETKEQKDNRTAYDIWYVENWTPWLDLRIIYLTVFSEKTYKAAF